MLISFVVSDFLNFSLKTWKAMNFGNINNQLILLSILKIVIAWVSINQQSTQACYFQTLCLDSAKLKNSWIDILRKGKEIFVSGWCLHMPSLQLWRDFYFYHRIKILGIKNKPTNYFFCTTASRSCCIKAISYSKLCQRPVGYVCVFVHCGHS